MASQQQLLISKRPGKVLKQIKKPTTSEPTFDDSIVTIDEDLKTFTPSVEKIVDSEYFELMKLNKRFKDAKVDISQLTDEILLPVDKLQFNMLTPKDIKGISVIEITNFMMEGVGSIHDIRLGPIGSENKCVTCNGVYKRKIGETNVNECPGHWSYIELMIAIPHPLCTKEILTYLRLFCNNEKCGRLLFTQEQIKLLNLPKNLNARLSLLSEYREQIKVCGHCEKNQPKITAEDNKFYTSLKDSEQPLSYERINSIFENIVPQDLQILGIDPEYTHPSYFLIKCLPVLPPCVRQFLVKGEGNVCHDDLSYKYTDIVKFNNELKKSSNETRTEELLTLISNTIHYMMDNSKGKSKDPSGHRPIMSLKHRLEGKHGHVRSTQGKRVDFCARTVITGDANCDVDELIVPLEFAENLTIPVIVNGINIKECQRILDNDEVVYIIRKNKRNSVKVALYTAATKFTSCDKLRRGEKIFTHDEIQTLLKKNLWTFKDSDVVIHYDGNEEQYVLPTRKPFKLAIGDIIERKIRNGDYVIFNRQPTLWKGSMRSKRVTLREGKTFRFNVASTQAFNADYDKISVVNRRA
jgi:DNA-directed RNA polymerase beta' subunit